MMKLTKQSQMAPISSVIRQLLIQLESVQSVSGLFGSYKKDKHRMDIFPPSFLLGIVEITKCSLNSSKNYTTLTSDLKLSKIEIHTKVLHYNLSF